MNLYKLQLFISLGITLDIQCKSNTYVMASNLCFLLIRFVDFNKINQNFIKRGKS